MELWAGGLSYCTKPGSRQSNQDLSLIACFRQRDSPPRRCTASENNTALWEPMLKPGWACGRHLTCKLYLEENGEKPSVRLSPSPHNLGPREWDSNWATKHSEIWRPSCKSIKAMTDHQSLEPAWWKERTDPLEVSSILYVHMGGGE